MALDTQTADLLGAAVGATALHELGVLTETMIARYADAIGESDNPLYHDLDSAHAAGYGAIPAPLNLLPSIMSWGSGKAAGSSGHEEELIPLTTVPVGSLLVMGGGESMTFHRPALAGDTINQRSELTSVTTKNASKGLLTILVYRHEFLNASEQAILTSDRTLLVR